MTQVDSKIPKLIPDSENGELLSTSGLKLKPDYSDGSSECSDDKTVCQSL